ncbi:hypothetical protein ACH3XW_49655 [Acanthocheilonema viteae]
MCKNSQWSLGQSEEKSVVASDGRGGRSHFGLSGMFVFDLNFFESVLMYIVVLFDSSSVLNSPRDQSTKSAEEFIPEV